MDLSLINKKAKAMVFVCTLAAMIALSPPAQAQSEDPEEPYFEATEVVIMLLPDRAALSYLVENGWDLDHDVRETDAGIVVTVIATPTEIRFLESEMGFVRLGTDFDEDAWQRVTSERKAAIAALAAGEEGDTITILRADYLQSPLGDSISVEAKSSAGSDADLTVTWVPAPIFGITCEQAVGLGNVPDHAKFEYRVTLYDPGTNSGTGHVTNRVWRGKVRGPGPFDAAIKWPITPSEGDTTDDTYYRWKITQDEKSGHHKGGHGKGGHGKDELIIAEGDGYFDCDDPLPVVPETESDSLNDFVDAGQYLYHRGTESVDGRPTSLLTIKSSEGGSAMAAFTEWLPGDPGNQVNQIGFVDHYMDPTELYERIESLADEFPQLAEIVKLPYMTNGYRRQAQATLGTSSSNRVVVSSHAWGHEGGNDIVVETLDPAAADADLSVSTSGNKISVSLATDTDGNLTSNAAEVRDAINADPAASALVYADPYRNNSGNGVVPPDSEQLSDFLNAPPEISREPWQVRAIRIGRHRNGSRVGVFAYAQEHAREWVPPLIAVETAERLLRNYKHGGSRKLIDNLDIFIVPSANPDGAHYSFYNYGFQRKNMVNYCPRGNQNDPGRRNQWGVDNNRNYDVGSLFDGYTGASTNCRRSTFAGPFELSEAESANVAWLADTYTNIRFSMNIHSTGNYFMWSPGAYTVPGRISLPRPTLGEESYFWASSVRILEAIKGYRGLVVTPRRTGPIVDVLYSAAGNSGDRLWYANHFYAWNFEVGGAGFQPGWEEAFEETMEFSDGLIELFRVALDFSRDRHDPASWLVDTNGNAIRKPYFKKEANLRFAYSEPATVYYTLDGSRPTYDSTLYHSAGLREPGEVLSFDDDATIKWFAVDSAGNVSRNYRPDHPRSRSYYSERIRIK